VSGILGLTGAGIGYTAVGKVWQALLSSGEFVELLPLHLANMLGVADSLAVTPWSASDEMVVGALAVSAFSMVAKEWLYRYTV
jgi:divalent metal cation (Fe/Co/Zn/Cd) transporter